MGGCEIGPKCVHVVVRFLRKSTRTEAGPHLGQRVAVIMATLPGPEMVLGPAESEGSFLRWFVRPILALIGMWFWCANGWL